MKNDGSYFLFMINTDKTVTKYKPDRVFPFTWRNLEFFVHRPYLSLIQTLDDSFWEVSEKTTGRALGDKSITTIASARELAIRTLERAGVTKVKELIKHRKDANEKFKVAVT
jgi:hypothetical protein